MPDKIKDELIAEVSAVHRNHEYLNGYSKPAVDTTSITLEAGSMHHKRSGHITIPGDLPLGTRFKITVEQIDEVSPATIIRGAIPNVIEAPQLQAMTTTAPPDDDSVPLDPALRTKL